MRGFNMSISNGNIFAIEKPQSCMCKVNGYLPAHSLMYIEIVENTSEESVTFCLAFESVQYFEGPLSWQGASFRLGTQHEKLSMVELLKRSDPGKSADYYNHLLQRYDLFVLEESFAKVQIFAANASRESQCPQISMIFPEP
jgi:hypothetical protein